MANERYQYTAYSKDPKVVERVLLKMEGQLALLRKMPADKRPRAMPSRYVAAHLGCAVGTVKRWLQYHDGRRDDHEVSERFCDIYQLIANELSEVVSSKTFLIASDTENSQAFRAQQWLLKMMDPWTFDGKQQVEARAAQVADIPSEVFDAMSDAERAALQRIADAQDKMDSEVEALLEQVALRIADIDEDL
jgi:hypothetical protein